MEEPRVGVGVMLLQGDLILLGKRNDDPEKASSALHGEGTYTMPGGKVHFGETLYAAVCRETLEETGIEVYKDDLSVISVADDIAGSVHFVTVGFLANHFAGEPKTMEPERVAKWDWYSLDRLPQPIYFPSQKIIENYLSKKIYKAKI